MTRTPTIRTEADPILTDRDVERLIGCSGAFSLRQINTKEQLATTIEAMRALEAPAPAIWVQGRVVTMLAHYPAMNMPDQLMVSVARDWIDTIGHYPGWTIRRACAWWISRHNEKRSFRPVPGDIDAQCWSETAPLRIAALQIERFQKLSNRSAA